MGSLRLPKILGNGCVLQQKEKVRIWGWGNPGETVEVSFRYPTSIQNLASLQSLSIPCQSIQCQSVQSQSMEFLSAQAMIDEQGRFEVLVNDLQPGGPFVLRVSNSSGDVIEVSEVYVGEVFVCSGQSNAELPMARVRERFPEEFVSGAPQVHEYKVVEHYDFLKPLADHVEASWRACTPERLGEISALAYFLGKQLLEEKQVPIGILNLSLGGTPVEAWTSEAGLADYPEYLEYRKPYESEVFCQELMAGKEKEEQAWYGEIGRQEALMADIERDSNKLSGSIAKEERNSTELQNNLGNQNWNPTEQQNKLGNQTWNPIELPCFLDDAGLEDFKGCLYLRRAFTVSEACAGKAGLLRFGALADSDHIYINDVLVGETGYRFPPRRYPIPEGLLKAGDNEIHIRLICRTGDGRVTPKKPYEILFDDKSLESIPLSGSWEYQIRAVCGPAPEQEFINRKPTGLFHGMVAPCLPYTVRGVVWYQGESNDCRPDNYRELLTAMIADWRSQWKQEKLPFVIIQLPDCVLDIAEGDAWPRIREAQRQVAATVPDTALTVNLELGEDNDIHPLDKKTVAYRAFLAIQMMIYGEDVVWKGPEVQTWNVEGNRAIITFDTGDVRDSDNVHTGDVRDSDNVHTGDVSGSDNVHTSNLCDLNTLDGQEPQEFEVCGEDGIYYPAKAEIAGKTVTVTSEEVEHICGVRYAWSKAPRRGLLCNSHGLPASPFVLK